MSPHNSPVAWQQARAGATGASWSTEVHDLLTPEEASRLFSRDDRRLRQLVIWAGRAPLVLQRAFYDKHALFAGQFDRGGE